MALFPLLFFALSSVYIFQFAPLKAPLFSDNQLYFFIAERAASGVPPHVSFFTAKTQLTTLSSAAAIRWGRAVGGDDLTSARLLSIFVTAAIVALAWLAAYQLGRSLLAAHLAALATMALGGLMAMGAMGVRPKVFMCLFLLATFLAVDARRPFWAGVSSGLAFLCWQPAALVSATALVALLLGPRRVRTAIAYAVGVFAVLVPYEVYFLASGALEDQLFQTFTYPSRFLAHGVKTKAVLRNLSWFLHVERGFGPRSVLPFLMLLAVLGGWVVAMVRPRWALDRVRDRPGWLYLFLGSQVAIAFTVYDYQGFPDRFLAEPFMVLGAALLVGLPLASLRPRLPATAWGALAMAAIVGALLLVRQHPLPRYGGRLAYQYRLAERIRGMIDDGLGVYAVGCGHLLAFAQRDNYSPYGLGLAGMRGYFEWKYGSEPWRPMRDGRLPDIVLHSRGRLPGGEWWLQQYYREVEDAEFAALRIKLYALEPAESPAD